MTIRNALLSCSLIAFCLSASAQSKPQASDSPMPERPGDQAMGDAKGSIKKARVFFIEPKDGDTVPRKFKVKMGVEGLKVRAADEAPDEVTSGHHHITLNSLPPPSIHTTLITINSSTLSLCIFLFVSLFFLPISPSLPLSFFISSFLFIKYNFVWIFI